jgi:hypothetical protein
MSFATIPARLLQGLEQKRLKFILHKACLSSNNTTFKVLEAHLYGDTIFVVVLALSNYSLSSVGGASAKFSSLQDFDESAVSLPQV